MRLDRLIVVLSLALPAALSAQAPPGACLVQDTAFQTTGGGCADLVANRVWSAVPPSTGTWSYANQYSQNLVEGGYSDWRLPTLSELTALVQDGGYSHLNLCQCGWWYWSSQTQGRSNAYAEVLQTGQTKKWSQNSQFAILCVRTGTPGGPQGAGGGIGSADLSVSHIHEGGVWTLLIRGERLAGRPYLLLAGLRAGEGARGIAAPILLPAQRTGSRLLDPGAGRLDEKGCATLRLDLAALGMPRSVEADIRLALVVFDPLVPGGIVYLITPPPNSDGSSVPLSAPSSSPTTDTDESPAPATTR